MRAWLILLIALVNGVAWWWLDAQRALRLTEARPQVHRALPSAPDIPKLLLLSEAVPAPQPPGKEPPVAEIETVPLPPAEPQAQEALPTEIPSPAAVPEPGATSSSAAAADLEPESAPAAVADPRPAVAEATPAAVVPAECLVLGGTTSRAQLMAWRDKLLAAEISVGEKVEAATETRPSSYRVYLPAGEAPQQKIAALREAGIEALLVADGSGAPRISAGVFRVQANAQLQQQRLIGLGYSAQVLPLQRPISRFWMTISGPPGLKDRATALLGGTDLGLGWGACPEAATGATARTQDTRTQDTPMQDSLTQGSGQR